MFTDSRLAERLARQASKADDAEEAAKAEEALERSVTMSKRQAPKEEAPIMDSRLAARLAQPGVSDGPPESGRQDARSAQASRARAGTSSEGRHLDDFLHLTQTGQQTRAAHVEGKSAPDLLRRLLRRQRER